MYYASSDDGGVTWSAPVRAGTVLVGTQPVVQPNGALTVVAGDYNGEEALRGTIVALHSTDGGVTWAEADIDVVETTD